MSGSDPESGLDFVAFEAPHCEDVRRISRPDRSSVATNTKAVRVPAHRLREARKSKNIGLRDFAGHLDISPSALSQIETGKAQPSLRTLVLLTRALGLSLDELFDRPNSSNAEAARTGAARSRGTPDSFDPTCGDSPLQAWQDRACLEVGPGVRWERLTRQADPLVDFLCVTYRPGTSSTSRGEVIRHPGREYGVVLAGSIEVTVGFETYECRAGDSISFDATEPHVVANRGTSEATAIWVVVGRRHSLGRAVVLPEARVDRVQPD